MNSTLNNALKKQGHWPSLLSMSALLILAIAVTACGSGGDNEDAPSAIVPDTDTVTVSSEEEPASETPAVAVEDPEDQSDEEPAVVEEDEPPAMVIPQRPPADYDAAAATITIDGEVGDWATIAPLEIQLSAITDREGEVGDYDARLRVATDTINLYVLVEIDDDYDFNLDDHNLSPALAVMFPIDAAAGTAMGATEDDQETSLGLTDVWHWELDCVAGELSGLVSAAGGNDPACNLDDEWASAPEDREDDASETSLIGVWQHTNAEPGADGTWIFEMARPLTTDDAEDAQFTAGSAIDVALAYWDPDETDEGWEDDGHAVSVSGERAFLSVSLPFEQETAGLVGPSIAEQSATATTISVDGAIDDWARVVPIEIELAPIADRVGEVGEYTSRVRFTADADTLYVLVEVDDDYDFNLDDHNLSPALAVMFPIDAAAGTAMGATEDDQENSLGLTDVWHWELDCVAGAQSGRISDDGGNDPDCNLDDEWALAPEDRKDDAAETSLIGVWSHTNPVVGGDGTWIFEMARPLSTNDPEDAQFALGEEFQFAIAYWDPDETDEGWDDDGHAVNVSDERPFLSFTLSVVTVSARNRPVDDEQAVTARLAAPTSSGTVVTVDARNADGWTFFDFGLGQVVQASLDSSDWQLAFQRTTLLTNSGATNRSGTSGALDLGAVEFDEAGIGGAGVFVVDSPNDSGEVLNPAISSWYNYRFIDHLIEAKPNVYAVRAGDDSVAFVRFDSYYCQDGSPGCVTFVYRLVRP